MLHWPTCITQSVLGFFCSAMVLQYFPTVTFSSSCTHGCGWDTQQLLQEGIKHFHAFLSFTLLNALSLCCRSGDETSLQVMFPGSCSFIFSCFHQEGWAWEALSQICTMPLCHYSNVRCSQVFHLVLPQPVLFSSCRVKNPCILLLVGM